MSELAPALAVAAAWLLFFATHVLMGQEGLRRRLGPTRHFWAHSLVSAATFTVLCWVYGQRRFSGAPGPGLATAAVQPGLVAAAVAGVVLMAAGAAAYPRAPMRVLRTQTPEPTGLQRISRHPFFVGTTLWGAAHALLAMHLTGTVFFGGLALMAGTGTWIQDRKLARRRGEPYRAYVAATSTVPFVALLRRRQRLGGRDLPGLLAGLAVGLAAAWLLRHFHAELWAWDGLGVALFTIVGSASISRGALRPDPVQRVAKVSATD